MMQTTTLAEICAALRAQGLVRRAPPGAHLRAAQALLDRIINDRETGMTDRSTRHDAYDATVEALRSHLQHAQTCTTCRLGKHCAEGHALRRALIITSKDYDRLVRGAADDSTV
jgi:hypothetical protein